MLGVGCNTIAKSKVDAGDFPPCIRVSEDEVNAIREMTKNSYITNEAERDRTTKKEKEVINVLGRMANWCKAYHARIGYDEPSIKKEEAK